RGALRAHAAAGHGDSGADGGAGRGDVVAITGTNAAHACREALAPEAAPRGPVVLLDKDGTLLEDVPYNTDPARMRFAPGAKRGLAMLAAAGFRFAVVSN